MWQFLSIFLALIVAATIYHDLMIVTSSMPNWSAESQSLMPRKYFSDASQEGATEQGDILRMYSADAIREMEVIQKIQQFNSNGYANLTQDVTKWINEALSHEMKNLNTQEDDNTSNTSFINQMDQSNPEGQDEEDQESAFDDSSDDNSMLDGQGSDPSTEYEDQGVEGGDDNQDGDPQEPQPHDGDNEGDNDKGSPVLENGLDEAGRMSDQSPEAEIRQEMGLSTRKLPPMSRESLLQKYHEILFRTPNVSKNVGVDVQIEEILTSILPKIPIYGTADLYRGGKEGPSVLKKSRGIKTGPR